MSYSFSVRATDKAEVKSQVALELDKVVSSQPVHAVDRDKAEDAIGSFVDLLRTDDTQEISLSVSGSCWEVEEGLNSVGLNISTSLVPKQAGKVTQPTS